MSEINLDASVVYKGITCPISYVQGTNTIPIIIRLTDYTIPTGSTVRIYIKKPSGYEVYNDCTFSGNVITVNPTLQMFAEAGRQAGQVQVLNGQKILVSFPLVFDVEKNIIDSSAIESSDEYTALDGILAGVSETMQKAGEATQSATNAAKAATTAATNAQTVANTVQRKLDNGEFNGPKGDPGSIENIASQPVSFTQAATAANIKSGDTVATLFGKLLKFQIDENANWGNLIDAETIAAAEAAGIALT